MKRVRKSLSFSNNYKKLINNIPDSGNILLKNVGTGEISLLAALVHKDAKFAAVVEDEENYLTAKNCVSVPENLIYLQKEDKETTYDYIIDCHGE